MRTCLVIEGSMTLGHFSIYNLISVPFKSLDEEICELSNEIEVRYILNISAQ